MPKALVIAADIAGSAFWTTGIEAAVQTSLRKTVHAADLTSHRSDHERQDAHFQHATPLPGSDGENAFSRRADRCMRAVARPLPPMNG